VGREVDRAHPIFSVSNMEGCKSVLVVDGLELDTIVNASPVIQWEEGISELSLNSSSNSTFRTRPSTDTGMHIREHMKHGEQRRDLGSSDLFPRSWIIWNSFPQCGVISRKKRRKNLKTDLSTLSMLVHHSAKDKTSSVLSGRRIAWFKHYGLGIAPARLNFEISTGT